MASINSRKWNRKKVGPRHRLHICISRPHICRFGLVLSFSSRHRRQRNKKLTSQKSANFATNNDDVSTIDNAMWVHSTTCSFKAGTHYP